jgi:hypothetical protein
MPKARRLLTNFSRGELSPRIEGRPDLSAYFEGCKELTNFLLLRQGGVERRPGTRFVKEVKDSTKDTLLIPFEFSVSDAYQLEFGHLYIRFYKVSTGARIEIAGVPIEVITPYTEADLRNIHYRQSADVLYLWDGAHPQHKLSRFSDTLWTLSTVQHAPPATLEAGTSLATRMIYGSYTAFPGVNDSFVIDDPLFLAADVGRELVAGGGKAIITGLLDARTIVGEVRSDFDASKIIPGPGVLSSIGVDVTTTLPHGVTTSDYIRIQSGAQLDEKRRVMTVPTPTTMTIESAFTVDQNDVDWERHIPIEASGWHIGGSPQTTLNPNIKGPVHALVTLVAGVDAFRDSDVGKYVFVYDGLIKITQIDSPTQVKGTILTVLSGSTATNPAATDAGTWTIEETAWTEARGYPRTGEFYQGRLGQASTVTQPTTFWLSASDDYENYAKGITAADSIEYTIASRSVNRIEWLADNTDLLIGTTGMEYSVRGDRLGEPLGGDKTPLIERFFTLGCLGVQPALLNRQVIYIDRSGKKVLVMAYSPYRDVVEPMEVTLMAEHITESGIRLAGMGLHQRIEPSVYFVRNDGVMVVLMFYPSEKVIGFTRITMKGTIECLSVTPQPSGRSDQVWVIVKRTIGGQTKRYIEYFEPDVNNIAFQARAWSSLQTDSAVIYAVPGTPITIFTGFSHLEGEMVDVIAGGSFIGTQIVTGGQITLDDAADHVEAGLHYSSRLETMRPAIEGSVIEGLPRSWDDLSVRLLNTIGGKVNGQSLQYVPSDLNILGLFTGDRKIAGQDWDTEGRIVIEQDQPYPMTILSLYGTLSVGDRP